MPGDSVRAYARLMCHCALVALVVLTCANVALADRPKFGFSNRKPKSSSSSSAYSQRQAVINDLPMQRLTRNAQSRILSVAKSPTIYRRLPTQAIRCDRDMFLFLTRNPDVLVGIWDLMGITQVKTERLGPYRIAAEDGSGTKCEVDLVYGDPSLHIFVATGSYDGKLVARPIRGKGVFILRSGYAQTSNGSVTVSGTLDCFIQIESLGADLIARTLSGLIGRSADHNFSETAKFVSQISQASERNPPAMMDIAQRMPQVQPSLKSQFVDVIATVARRAEQTAAIPITRPPRR